MAKASFKDRLMKVHCFYGVEVVFTVPDFYKIQYVLECDYLGYDDKGYQYRIRRQKFYINDKELTDLMDVLAEKCMQVVYPLVLNIGFAGTIKGVANLDAIKKRWADLKPRLKMEYKGTMAEEYLERIEDALATPETFMARMRKDVVFQLLIPKLHANNSNSFRKENVIQEIPDPDGTGFLLFKGAQEMNPYPNDQGLIEVSFEGDLHRTDAPYGDHGEQGSLRLTHFLDQNDASLVHLFGNCSISAPEAHKIEYKIVRMNDPKSKNA